jgi:hypothetical protein
MYARVVASIGLPNAFPKQLKSAFREKIAFHFAKNWVLAVALDRLTALKPVTKREKLVVVDLVRLISVGFWSLLGLQHTRALGNVSALKNVTCTQTNITVFG